MDHCDRREFFRRTSLTAGALVIPGWLRRGFWPQDGEENERERALRAASRRALAHGKPILVFVVPAEQPLYWERGEALGAFLNHGGQDAMVDLALCIPVCATLEEVRGTLKTDDIAGDPWMLLIEQEPAKEEGGRATTHVAPITPRLEDMKRAGPVDHDDYEAWQKAAHDEASARVAAIQTALRAAIAPDRAALVARADACRAHLATDDLAELNALIAGRGQPDTEVVGRGAAVLRMAAEAPREDGDRERLLTAVSDAARALWIDERIPGSKWASQTGCGVDVEGEEAAGLAIACGMGMVPPLGRRLLYFFTSS